MTDQLTERQSKILDYIRYVTRVRSYPPSVREIGEAVGLSSSSTVHNHLNQLERRGLIKRDPSKSRTVQLVSDAQVDMQRRNAVSIPIIGNVAAHFPGETLQFDARALTFSNRPDANQHRYRP